MPNLSDLLGLPLRYRYWRLEHIALSLRDLRGGVNADIQANHIHLTSAIQWLCRAQDSPVHPSPDGGISAGWSFEEGWLPSYPETSGYIVETFIAAGALLEDDGLIGRANRILDWELGLQMDDGSFPGHFGEPGSRPVIFNTGQIMHGMIAGHFQLGRNECLEAAEKAGRWMIESQDADGCWRRNVHNGIPHTYNTRAAWALARTGLAVDDRNLVSAARRNCEWALTQQNDAGWYASNAFETTRNPFSHTIAYAIRGLLETGLELGEERFVSSAARAARALAKAQRPDGWLGGTYDAAWKTTDSYSCLTGIAQMCIAWERMAQIDGTELVSTAAARGLDYLKRQQAITGRKNAVDGGIAGSFPIWGGYSRFEYPNWATKFFADALMMNATPECTIPVPINPDVVQVKCLP